MAPHDSDSSGDSQDDYTETNVLLGYASKEPEDISHLGGRPEWLDPESPPSAALARCKVCRDLMVLLLQLNAELPAQFPGHERRLYVFSCRRKTCRRKEGSIRVVRGVRIAPGSNSNATKDEEEKPKQPKQESSPTPAPPPPSNLGETLFGAKTLGLSSLSSSSSPFASANPFSTGNSSNPFSSSSNPFSSTSNTNNTNNTTTEEVPSNPAPTTDNTAVKEEKEGKEQLGSLPKTFAETLSLNNPQSQSISTTITTTAPPSSPPPEPWPPETEQPRPYTTAYLTDAEYETLDPTPAPIPQATVQMDVDNENDNSKGGKGGGKEDRDVFESTMDAAFQKFADRLAQNPEQAIRYEFGGQPLLSSREDAVGLLLSTDDTDNTDDDINNNNNSKVKVKGGSSKGKAKAKGKGMPRCANCGARRTFEVQLCPQAIAELEADEDVQAQLEEGIDWATVVVGVCERDCQAPGVGEGNAGYLEEWAGVQWEELSSGGRR